MINDRVILKQASITDKRRRVGVTDEFVEKTVIAMALASSALTIVMHSL